MEKREGGCLVLGVVVSRRVSGVEGWRRLGVRGHRWHHFYLAGSELCLCGRERVDLSKGRKRQFFAEVLERKKCPECRRLLEADSR